MPSEFGRGGEITANSGEQCMAAARCREEEEEAKRPGKGVRSDFIAARCFREERERERERERSRAKPRTAGGADVLDGAAWQLLGIGGPTWNGEGRTAEMAQAVGGRRERRVGERERCRTAQRRPAQQRRRGAAPAVEGTRAGGGRRGRAGRGQRRSGKRWGRGQDGTWHGPERRRAGSDGAHGRTAMAVCRRGETEEGEKEVDEGGLKRNFREKQGLHYKASITFKPVLKWRWSQKQKCMVFRALQLCFRVHLQKSNSFEIIIKLSKVFKLYKNFYIKTTLHLHPRCSFTYIYDLNVSFQILQNNPHTFEIYPPYIPI
jgi:hypothetical protein